MNRRLRSVVRFVADWRNGATLIATILVGLLVVQVIDGITARRESIRVATATALQAKSAQQAATRRIDQLTRAGHTRDAEIRQLIASYATLAQQIRDMGATPPLSRMCLSRARSRHGIRRRALSRHRLHPHRSLGRARRHSDRHHRRPRRANRCLSSAAAAMPDDYRLEDHFCPGCLSARHDLCDGLNYWCTCWCVDDDPALRDGPPFRLPGMRLPMPPEEMT